GLRDQSRLRPWLYAVARNECHRRLRETASGAGPALDLVPEMSDESADVTGGAERAELRTLLRSAVRGLNASERDLIELQLRQELDVAEIAAILGVTRNHAHALLSRPGASWRSRWARCSWPGPGAATAPRWARCSRTGTAS